MDGLVSLLPHRKVTEAIICVTSAITSIFPSQIREEFDLAGIAHFDPSLLSDPYDNL